MTRKDYVKIAEAVYDVPRDTKLQRDAQERIAHNLCKVLREDNPAFDSERFLKACGVW